MLPFPHDILRSPGPLVEDVASVAPDAQVVATRGSARGLTRLADLPQLRHLWVSGLNAAQLDVISHLHRLEVLVVHEMRASDLSPLGKLARLRDLVIWTNARATDLAALTALGQLRRLALENLPRVTSLDPISRLSGLRALDVQGGSQGTAKSAMTIESLAPLGGLVELEELALLNLHVVDGSLRPLGRLPGLHRLDLANYFELEEIAYLAAAHPDLDSEALRSHITTNIPCKACGGTLAMLRRARRAFICPTCRSGELADHVARFGEAVRRHRVGMASR